MTVPQTLGQERPDVASHFALDSMADIATIRYEEQIGDTIFVKSIHVKFADDRLVRIQLSDYRE